MREQLIKNIIGNVMEGVTRSATFDMGRAMDRSQFIEIMQTLEAALIHASTPEDRVINEAIDPDQNALLPVQLIAGDDDGGVAVVVARVLRGDLPEVTLVVDGRTIIKRN